MVSSVITWQMVKQKAMMAVILTVFIFMICSILAVSFSIDRQPLS